MNNETKKLQKNLLDQIVVLSTIYMWIDFLMVSIRYYSVEIASFFIIKGALAFFLLCFTLFGKKISFHPKIDFLAMILLSTSLIEIWHTSFNGFNIFFVAIFPLLALLITQKQAIWVALVICLIFSGLGICYAYGYLVPSPELNKLNKDPFRWLTILISIIALSYVVINSFQKFYFNLNKHFEEEGLAEKKYKILFANANHAIFLLSEGMFFDANAYACELFKYKHEDLIGKSLFEVSPAFQPNGMSSSLLAQQKLNLANEGKPQKFEFQHLNADGKVIDCIISLHRVELQNQTYQQAFLTDISNEKKKERERKVAQTKYKMLFEKANIGIMLLSENRRFINVNQEAANYFKLKPNEIIGQSPAILSPKRQEDGSYSEVSASNYITLAFEGKPQQFEWQHLDSEGSTFDCIVSLHNITFENNSYLQAIITDVTKEKSSEKELHEYKNHLEDLIKTRTLELEDKSQLVEKQNNKLQKTLKRLQKMQSQLVQAEKMASLGVLTAGISHEINNPLQYLFGIHKGFEMYFEKYKSHDKETTDKLLESTDTAINRIASIVRGLNQFSRENDNLNEDCDLHAILNNCLSMLRNQYKNQIRIDTKYLDQAIIIKGNVGKLHQVFTNILSNAIQAIEKQGIIAISTSLNKSNAQITIIDNGCGIDEEHLLKITDPFYSTKNPGKGTGLGLSISYSIVQSHKGSLQFKSTPHIGTEVQIKFPLN